MLNSATKFFYQPSHATDPYINGTFGDLLLVIDGVRQSLSEALCKEGFGNRRVTLFRDLVKTQDQIYKADGVLQAGPFRAKCAKWQIDIQKLLPPLLRTIEPAPQPVERRTTTPKEQGDGANVPVEANTTLPKQQGTGGIVPGQAPFADVPCLLESPDCVLEHFRLKHMAYIAEQRRTIGPKSKRGMYSEISNGVHVVLFDAAESPAEVYIRLAKYDERLKDFEADLDRYARENDKKHRTRSELGSWKAGMYCLARYKEHWFRAKIIEVHDNTEVTCFFVDHGDKSRVSLSKDILEIEQYQLYMLFQAIECRLAGVQKVTGEEEWRFAAVDAIYDCSANISDYARDLFLKVCTIDDDERPAVLIGFKVPGLNTVSFINRILLELNLAEAKSDEIDWLNVDSIEE